MTPGGTAPLNRIQLSGILCKQPVLRRTPLGREICDMILAVNRRYGRADYLPCIAWGAVAQQAACLHTGQRFTAEGPGTEPGLYENENGVLTDRTAYEVSIMRPAEVDAIPSTCICTSTPTTAAARYDVDMTKGSITKHLINFALPLMVGNLFQQLYNMVDTWVVGNYVSNEAFSAVGTVGLLSTRLSAFSWAFPAVPAWSSASITVPAARIRSARRSTPSLVLTLLMGAVFTAAGIAMTPLMLQLMKTPAEVAPEQATYLTDLFRRSLRADAVQHGPGILRAVGDSRRPISTFWWCPPC